VYGNLNAKYLASDGGPGTYKRFAGGQEWRKDTVSSPSSKTFEDRSR
jgi:hypothetical protein